jgi:hypothetical protein
MSYGYRATINVPMRQLENLRIPDVFYVFAIRHDNKWKDFIVISRQDLLVIRKATHMGTRIGPDPETQQLVIHLAFRADSIRSGTADFQPYRNNWNRYWLTIVH